MDQTQLPPQPKPEWVKKLEELTEGEAINHGSIHFEDSPEEDTQEVTIRHFKRYSFLMVEKIVKEHLGGTPQRMGVVKCEPYLIIAFSTRLKEEI